MKNKQLDLSLVKHQQMLLSSRCRTAPLIITKSHDVTITICAVGERGGGGTYQSLRGVQVMYSINNNTDTVLQMYKYNTGHLEQRKINRATLTAICGAV